MMNEIDHYIQKEKKMRRRIVLEMDCEDNEVVNDILKMIAERMDPNVDFSIRQEIIPEKISKEIQVPNFSNALMREMQEGVR